MHKNKKPVLSNMFIAVEGIYGVTLQYPVLSSGGALTGSVSAFFKPQDFFSPLAESILKDSSLEVWVVDDNGTVIYDQDERKIGRNVLTEESYKTYPGYIAFVRAMINKNSGRGNYESPAKELNRTIKKEGAWRSVGLYGTKWHIAVVEVKEGKASLPQSNMQDAMDAVIKKETQTAVSLLDALYNQHKSGKLSLDEAKKMGADLLRELRYGDNQEGYFWVDTIEGVNIVLYGRKDVEGKNRYEANINGVYYIKKIIENGKQPGGGYTDYWFPKKGEETPVKKRGYSLLFKPFGWVVGTGYYPEI